MLEEPARVVRVFGKHAEVETRTQVGCGRCASGRGCGAGTIAQALANSNAENVTVRLSEDLSNNTQSGDIIMVGLDERAVVVGSLALYILPLVTMLAIAIATNALFVSEAATIVAAIAGFALGLLGVKQFGRRAARNNRYEPMAIKQLPASAWYGCTPESTEMVS